MSEAREVVERYFAALGRQDLDEALGYWAPGGIDRLPPVGEVRAPEGIRTYFEELFAAMPDFWLEAVSVIADGDSVAIQWRGGGTFTGAPYQGIRPTGARIEMAGTDVVRVEGGLIQRTDAYWDDSEIARQLGLLPPRRSRRERALIAMFNAKNRLRRRPRKVTPSA